VEVSYESKAKSLILLTAGAKGAVGSTLAVAVAALRRNEEAVLPYLATAHMFPYLGSPKSISMVGWDKEKSPLVNCIENHGALPGHLWRPYTEELRQMGLRQAPPSHLNIQEQVGRITDDIQAFKKEYPHSDFVFVNLLPGCAPIDMTRFQELSELYGRKDTAVFPDIAYVVAAVLSGLPVVNFTSNEVEITPIFHEAIKRGVPLSGRDGKTGQTYLKVVLASALKARNLFVDGWYSLNILGNEDGKNLISPEKGAGKIRNKTEVLDGILGYPVGKRYGTSSHKVHIDYYAPRGDAKEAWDVIDFLGLFGLPMSLRLNLHARDSILAAPLVLDLARWMMALRMVGRAGPIPELGFYFKKPIGDNPPLTFQDQLAKLHELELECDEKLSQTASCC
jgi:myo-inositol-1-phosphate synthase